MPKNRLIVHVDMDAFFASVEQRDDPSLRNRPVVVGADPKGGRGRGVVSTCSYEARIFGIHSAMPISEAYRKCPGAIFLPVDIEKYESVSNQIYGILYTFTPDIEPVGIDEAFLDISGSHHLFGSPRKTCELIKTEIRNKTGLTASIGLAPTKMAAKIASDLKKPDGLVEIKEEGLLDFLWPLDIRRIWGLGEKCEAILHSSGIRTIGELAAMEARKAVALLGKSGAHFWQLANGIDDRVVMPSQEAKSLSGEITFENDTDDRTRIEGALMSLAEKVSTRLRDEAMRCKTVTLKIRLADFSTFTRSITLAGHTNFTESLYKNAFDLYNEFGSRGKKIRLVGIKATNLARTSVREDLFRDPDCEKQEAVHSSIDKIRHKFGDGVIYRATAACKKER